jgi:hypothetical protein
MANEWTKKSGCKLKFYATNKNGNGTCLNLQDTANPVLQGKFIAISAYDNFSLSLYYTLCLFLFFNRTGEKYRTVSAWQERGRGKEGGGCDRREKWPKQCMHMWINE